MLSHFLKIPRVATDLLFYPIKERFIKEIEKRPLRNSGYGGRLYKGKVLAPFVSMVIHGLLSFLSSLVFRSLFNCFRMLICGFKYFCKLNFVMIRVRMYTKCLFIFRKMFLKRTLTL